MLAVEPMAREFCARPWIAGWLGRIRFHPGPGCADADADDRDAPGHSEEDQEAIRDAIDDGLTLDEDGTPKLDMMETLSGGSDVRRLHRLRPAPFRRSDDQMLNAEFEEKTVSVANSPALKSSYMSAMWPPPQRDGDPSDRWTGKVLAEHPTNFAKLRRTGTSSAGHRGGAALRGAVAGAGPLRHP